MKQLICAKDIEHLHAAGEQVCYVEAGAIITPSARDAADALAVRFCTHENQQAPASESALDFDSEKIYLVLKQLLAQGLLQDVLKPYDSLNHSNGLKVIRGESVRMDVFDTGNPAAKAFYQELVGKQESQISAGFLVIDHSRFEWELAYEEVDYVIEGTLTVTIDGKSYTAKAGDVVFVPAGSKVVWGSPDKARIFYATYPANWADCETMVEKDSNN